MDCPFPNHEAVRDVISQLHPHKLNCSSGQNASRDANVPYLLHETRLSVRIPGLVPPPVDVHLLECLEFRLSAGDHLIQGLVVVHFVLVLITSQPRNVRSHSSA